jgi:hypothetical protein
MDGVLEAGEEIKSKLIGTDKKPANTGLSRKVLLPRPQVTWQVKFSVHLLIRLKLMQLYLQLLVFEKLRLIKLSSFSF